MTGSNKAKRLLSVLAIMFGVLVFGAGVAYAGDSGNHGSSHIVEGADCKKVGDIQRKNGKTFKCYQGKNDNCPKWHEVKEPCKCTGSPSPSGTKSPTPTATATASPTATTSPSPTKTASPSPTVTTASPTPTQTTGSPTPTATTSPTVPVTPDVNDGMYTPPARNVGNELPLTGPNFGMLLATVGVGLALTVGGGILYYGTRRRPEDIAA